MYCLLDSQDESEESGNDVTVGGTIDLKAHAISIAIVLSLYLLWGCGNTDPGAKVPEEEIYIEVADLLKEYEHAANEVDLKYVGETIHITGIVKGWAKTHNSNARFPTPSLRIDGEHRHGTDRKTLWLHAGIKEREVEHTSKDSKVYLKCTFRGGLVERFLVEIYVDRCEKAARIKE